LFRGLNYHKNTTTYAKYINQKGQLGQIKCTYGLSPEYFQAHDDSCVGCRYIFKCISWSIQQKDAPVWEEYTVDLTKEFAKDAEKYEKAKKIQEQKIKEQKIVEEKKLKEIEKLKRQEAKKIKPPHIKRDRKQYLKDYAERKRRDPKWIELNRKYQLNYYYLHREKIRARENQLYREKVDKEKEA
jgi:hypothetical protein